MKRNILFILIGILTIFSSNGVIGQEKMANEANIINTIVIDAGHGGKDPGALGRYTKEKDVALKVALKTGEYIRKNLPDVKVIYTRSTDKFIELHRRSQIANDAHADFFISIHCNSAKSPRASGSETFIMGLNKSKSNLDVAKRENSVILSEENTDIYDGFDPTSPDSYIIFNFLQGEYQDKSTGLAGKIQSQFEHRVGRRSRGVKQAGFLVLHRSYMPRVLIELGFLSNPAEEKFLNSDRGQSLMASAIYRAFKEYKQEHDKRNSEAEKGKPKTAQTIAAKADQFKVVDGLVYRVQFATNRNRLAANHKTFGKLKEIYSYKQGKLWKYTSGRYLSFNQAMNYRNSIAKSGYKDAFVVAFKNDERMKDIQEARRATEELD